MVLLRNPNIYEYSNKQWETIHWKLQKKQWHYKQFSIHKFYRDLKIRRTDKTIRVFVLLEGLKT